ncbi:3,4-dihydroxy-2-butanone-4-phosphate synthase [Lactiplantibacillus plantarum]
MKFSTVDEALTQLKHGGLIIVSDNEGRENEGDLIGLGSKITGEKVNFMITHAKGLLCMPLSAKLADKFELKPIVDKNTEINGTAFVTTSDGSYQTTGVTTGISAFDRASTIKKFADPSSTVTDFVHPGHMFPLVAVNGGVRERSGHTEAAVELAKLAGEPEVGAIIEIIKDDGHMARRDFLEKMAHKYDLPFITIDQIIEYLNAQGGDQRE